MGSLIVKEADSVSTLSLFELNLRAIEPKSQEVAEALRSQEINPVSLEKAKNGAFTFRHRGRLFHSAYDPIKEAQTHADGILAKKSDWVVLFGMGCGHILQKLVENKKDKIIVYEPSIEILKGVLGEIDLSGPLGLEKVFLCTDIDTVVNIVNNEIEGIDSVIGHQSAPYKYAFPRELVQYANKVENAQIVNAVKVKTAELSHQMWISNYFENLDAFAQYPGIDTLLNKFAGVPMVIAGAGPSLKKNAHLLKELKGKALIVAAITAYKPLLTHGVVPDMVIAAEKIDLPEYFTYSDEDRQIRLLLGDVSHPNMFKRDVKGKFIYFNYYSALSVEQSKFFGSGYFPSSGGSVTTSALDLGLAFGCDPIILVGQDLSFGNDGRTHAGGGVYVSQDIKIDKEKGTVQVDEDFINQEMANAHLKNNFKLLWLKGLDGKPVASKYDWVCFHRWFENYMEALKRSGSKTRVINATEGGAWIEGMEHTALSSAIEGLKFRDDSIEDILASAENGKPEPDLCGLLESMSELDKSIKGVKKNAEDIVKESEKALKKLKKKGLVPGLASNIERIRAHEEKLFDSKGTSLLWEFIVAYTYRLKVYLKKERDQDEGKLFKDDIEAVGISYRKVLESCCSLLPMLDKAIENLKLKTAGNEK